MAFLNCKVFPAKFDIDRDWRIIHVTIVWEGDLMIGACY